MIPVGRLAPGNQWDQTLIDDLLDSDRFKRSEGYPSGEGCILIVPGRYWFERCNEISEALSRYQWVLGIRVGDEEDTFDVDRIVHPNILWWIQTPRTDRKYPEGSRFIGVGYTPHFRNVRPAEKTLDVFLSAQNTHTRREQCFNSIPTNPSYRVEATPGFTQGMTPAEYVECMTAAKVAPAPAGAASPDSFRFWEALQAGAIPIADDYSPVYDSTGFWDMLCPGAPFPVIRDYPNLPGYIDDQLRDYPRLANRVRVWWLRYRRQLSVWLEDDLKALGAV